MAKMNHLCEKINASTKPDKEEGPCTLLTFLGILLDTTTMQAYITMERKRDILQAIQELQGKRTCKKRRLLSLIGKLAFACKVVPPGRIFLRRLILPPPPPHYPHPGCEGRPCLVDALSPHMVRIQSVPLIRVAPLPRNGTVHGAYWAGR